MRDYSPAMIARLAKVARHAFLISRGDAPYDASADSHDVSKAWDAAVRAVLVEITKLKESTP